MICRKGECCSCEVTVFNALCRLTIMICIKMGKFVFAKWLGHKIEQFVKRVCLQSSFLHSDRVTIERVMRRCFES